MHQSSRSLSGSPAGGLSRSLIIAGALFAIWSVAVRADDDRLSRLSPANRQLAQDMEKFVKDMDDRYFGRVGKLNGGLKFEDLTQATETDDYDVRVARGPVVEKIGRLLAVGKKMPPGRVPKELVWGRFYSLDVHAKTPLVGMLHAVMVVQLFADGTGFSGGSLGVMNGTRVDADMAKLKTITDDYFKEKGLDPAPFRKALLGRPDDAAAKWRRRPDDSGVSLYGPPAYPEDATRSFEFASGLFVKFVDGYMDLMAKHRKDAGSQKDLRAQAEMRMRWLTDQLFWDPYSSKLVPWEVWSLANVPPVIKF